MSRTPMATKKSQRIHARRMKRRAMGIEQPHKQCRWTNPRSGKRCGAFRMIVEVEGKHYLAQTCYAHLPVAVARKAGIPTLHERCLKARDEGKLTGRPPTKPHTVLKRMVESNAMEWLQPFVEALQATKPVVVGNGPTARVELLPDDRARMQAANDVLDRVYGKPKQQIEGIFDVETENHTVLSAPPTDDQRARDVAKILADSGALDMAAIAAQANNPVHRN